MRIIDVAQSSPEWISLRKTKITGTDAASILGISPYCSAYLLWRRKLGLEPEQEVNAAMTEGSKLEPEARSSFIKETGIHVEPKVAIKDFQMASMDGVSNCGKYAVEIKCSKKLYEKALRNEIDDHYIAQMQHQMSVLDIDMIHYYCYWDGNGCRIEVKRDDEYISNLTEKEKQFFNNLMSFDPPELTDRDYKIRSDVDWEFDVMRWKHAKEKLKEFEKTEKDLRQVLIDSCHNNSTLGCGVKVTKYSERGRINYDMIPQLQGVDLNSFRKEPVEKWRVSEC